MKGAKQKLENETNKLVEFEESLDQLRDEMESKTKAVEEAETEVGALKKDGHSIDKELHALEKKILQQEQSIRRKAHERHSLLHECKINAIQLPLLRGTMDRLVVVDESLVDDSQSQSTSQAQSSQHSQSIDSAEQIEVDFKTLNAKTKRSLEEETDAAKVVSGLQKLVLEVEAKFNKLQAPANDANERMEQVKEREKETTEESEASRKKSKKARAAFERVKSERYRRFYDFFEPVSQRIDEIYKKLSQNESAQAFLGPVNQEEPYLDGINYNCIAPGKRFRPMDNLSGGEKTIAALALLFAIHSSNPSPFFVLDEIDAALDNTNIGKVVKYIIDRSRDNVQLIVISLKEELFNKADALVGVYPRENNPCMASGILTFDLENFNN
ncbi:Structural maintenance of chromosomes protein [Aphelenchoides bicaudatus]|nr:Structural maintenance of chromosomes protein [Aphelenchoides bicaudatus]